MSLRSRMGTGGPVTPPRARWHFARRHGQSIEGQALQARKYPDAIAKGASLEDVQFHVDTRLEEGSGRVDPNHFVCQ